MDFVLDARIYTITENIKKYSFGERGIEDRESWLSDVCKENSIPDEKVLLLTSTSSAT